MKRQLTANETLLVIEALKALMQDLKTDTLLKGRAGKTMDAVASLEKRTEAQTLRNALLQKDYKLFIEGP